MWNGMSMDPELMRIAQEQIGRMSPQEMASIQQQMMSNPELMKMASESMQNLRPEELRMAAEQIKHTRPEDMAEIGERMAKASPQELAAMRAQAEAHTSYELNAAQMLKQQGNELHSRGKFHEAAQKYLHAKNNLKGIPISKCITLQLQCSLNLMSCYLKTQQFEECIKEGSEAIKFDSKNVKALYRRGQAYKEMGNFRAAVSDLKEAHEASPEDETIAEVLRDANESLSKQGPRDTSRGVIIEEIVDEEEAPTMSEGNRNASSEPHTSQPVKNDLSSRSEIRSRTGGMCSEADPLQNLKDDPEAIRSFQNYISRANPESMAAMGAGGVSPEMLRTATDMIGKMKPDELQKMLQLASSMNMNNLNVPGASTEPATNGPKFSSFPEMTPEMVSMASESISKMSPEELQKMVEAASSLKQNSSPFSTIPETSGASTSSTRSFTASPSAGKNTSDVFPNSTTSASTSGRSNSTADLQESMKNSMRDPAMRQMFSAMMKNMNPEMMSNMSEQFGVKLSKEDAAKAQQAMSSLSPDDLERMMRWAERAQKGIETAKKTKNWLLGKPGMILAICVLILAFSLHKLGFIGS